MAWLKERKGTWFAKWRDADGKEIVKSTKVKVKPDDGMKPTDAKKLAQVTADNMERAAKGNVGKAQALQAVRSAFSVTDKVPSMKEYLDSYRSTGKQKYSDGQKRAFKVFLEFLGKKKGMRLNGGEICAHYEYDSFGNVLKKTGIRNYYYQFSTKPHDNETGLSYYNYRNYDPVMGRWVGRDRIAENGGLNLYGFLKNCPLSFDYLGLKEGDNCCSLMVVAAHGGDPGKPGGGEDGTATFAQMLPEILKLPCNTRYAHVGCLMNRYNKEMEEAGVGFPVPRIELDPQMQIELKGSSIESKKDHPDNALLAAVKLAETLDSTIKSAKEYAPQLCKKSSCEEIEIEVFCTGGPLTGKVNDDGSIEILGDDIKFFDSAVGRAQVGLKDLTPKCGQKYKIPYKNE